MLRPDGKLSHDLVPGEKGPQDECGVFGVWAPGEDVATLTYFGLYALQHRGQESAGIAASDGKKILVFKDMGLVSQVFNDQALRSLRGDMAVGHVRYSTTGSSTWENAQPTLGPTAFGTIALAHNGNLVNTADLRRRLPLTARDRKQALRSTHVPEAMRRAHTDLDPDWHPEEPAKDSSSDTEVLVHLIEAVSKEVVASGSEPALLAPMRKLLPDLEGAFSLAFMDETTLYAARDRHGIRPLVLGCLPLSTYSSLQPKAATAATTDPAATDSASTTPATTAPANDPAAAAPAPAQNKGRAGASLNRAPIITLHEAPIIPQVGAKTRLPEGLGWVVASETAALDIIGAQFVREVEPGELLAIDGRQLRSEVFAPKQPAGCVFEYVYLARPDTQIAGRSIQAARRAMGAALAAEHPVEADLVMATPESGTPAAIGYAAASGIPYGQGLVKNAYVGRTFIQPTQTMRQLGIRLKLNPLRSVIEGKRLIVVDDSIVRGNTQRALVQMLRAAGAAQVHVRISSPPVKWPCFYGIDFASRDELIANEMEIAEICASIGADTLGFLSEEAMVAATEQAAEHLCTACFTGRYPTALPEGILPVSNC